MEFGDIPMSCDNLAIHRLPFPALCFCTLTVRYHFAERGSCDCTLAGMAGVTWLMVEQTFGQAGRTREGGLTQRFLEGLDVASGIFSKRGQVTAKVAGVSSQSQVLENPRARILT